jgi:hypothetical protein
MWYDVVDLRIKDLWAWKPKATYGLRNGKKRSWNWRVFSFMFLGFQWAYTVIRGWRGVECLIRGQRISLPVPLPFQSISTNYHWQSCSESTLILLNFIFHARCQWTWCGSPAATTTSTSTATSSVINRLESKCSLAPVPPVLLFARVATNRCKLIVTSCYAYAVYILSREFKPWKETVVRI